MQTPLLLALLFSWLLPGTSPDAPVAPPVVETPTEAASLLYDELCLEGELKETVFTACYKRMERRGVTGHIVAIADMTQPSTAKRFYIIDLDRKELLLRTYVAHGQRSGDLMATSFSNREGSHQTSLGLYRVGAEIVSPKHGAALLLHGLEKGVNCQAERREVIMHGADYVSEDFIRENGRLGRSWGCPAVSRADMPRMLELLGNGAVLYVHG
ncbi:MAG: murein L,D-transpeptidase catalytic domain family protein [Flavobacteriales bacterium]|nr:murein L,D-transpeptidase catalytic domain family protein [Flavobacteriales bacterium]